MNQRSIQFGRKRHALFDAFGGSDQLFHAGVFGGTRHIFCRRPLEIKRADPVRTGFQKTSQLIHLHCIRVRALEPELHVDDYAPSPRIRRGVANAAGNAQSIRRKQQSRLQRQFRLVNGDRGRFVADPLKIALAVVERCRAVFGFQPPGHYRLGFIRQPNPHEGFFAGFRSHRALRRISCERFSAKAQVCPWSGSDVWIATLHQPRKA